MYQDLTLKLHYLFSDCSICFPFHCFPFAFLYYFNTFQYSILIYLFATLLYLYAFLLVTLGIVYLIFHSLLRINTGTLHVESKLLTLIQVSLPSPIMLYLLYILHLHTLKNPNNVIFFSHQIYFEDKREEEESITGISKFFQIGSVGWNTYCYR